MNPKVINSLSARVAKLEAMMENNDLFQQAGGASYGGLNYQGSEFGGLQFGDNYFQGSQFGDSQYQGGSAPQFPWEQYAPAEQQMAENYGFGANEQAISELMQRISELELLVAGGSNDTRQTGALDATQQVGDDASDGTGTAGGIPAGFTQVQLSICDNGVAKTMMVIGTVPA